MKILLVSAFKTNPYCTGHHLSYALEDMGHEVINLDFRLIRDGVRPEKSYYTINEQIEEHKDNVDILIVWKGSSIDPELIKSLSIPTVLWYCDDLTTSHGLNDVFRFHKAYDYIFTPILEDVKLYRKLFGVHTSRFLPVGASKKDIAAYENANISPLTKSIDVSFIGNMHSVRPFILDIVQQHCERKGYTYHFKVDYEDYTRVINASKINLNIGWLFKGTQLRMFEVTARGGFLLTNSCDSITNIRACDFMGTYGLHNLLSQIDYYLDHPEAREYNISKGIAQIKKLHLWQHRFETMFKEVGRI